MRLTNDHEVQSIRHVRGVGGAAVSSAPLSRRLRTMFRADIRSQVLQIVRLNPTDYPTESLA